MKGERVTQGSQERTWTILVCPECGDQVEWDDERTCWRHCPRTEANDHCGWDRDAVPNQVEVVPRAERAAREKAQDDAHYWRDKDRRTVGRVGRFRSERDAARARAERAEEALRHGYRLLSNMAFVGRPADDVKWARQALDYLRASLSALPVQKEER